MTTLRRPPPAGLLEQETLVLRHADDGRRLLHAATGEPVGFARRRPGGLLFGWPGPTLEVREQEESPLVCTVRRTLSLWPRHEVRDAEGELVGVLAGALVLDRWLRAALRVRAQEGGGQFLDGHGRVAARWADTRGERRLELLPEVQHDPFAKMLVLAAVLVR
jgi:hypothetical protein